MELNTSLSKTPITLEEDELDDNFSIRYLKAFLWTGATMLF